MTMRYGTITITWALGVGGAASDPDNLLQLSREEIAWAVAHGESAGVIVEQVLYDDEHGVPDVVTPIEAGGDP